MESQTSPSFSPRLVVGVAVMALFLFVWAIDIAHFAAGDLKPRISKRASSIRPGSKLPPLALKDMNDRAASLDEFKGGNLLLYVWTDWCGSCKIHIPDIQALHTDPALSLKVVSIAITRNPRRIAAIAKRARCTFPILIGDSLETTEKLNVDAYPTIILVDKTGSILLHRSGFTRSLRSEIETALSHPDTFSKNAAFHREKGYELEKRKKYSEAIREYEKALAENPHDVESWHRLGHAARKAGDPKTALKAFSKLNADHDCIKHNLFHIYEDLGDYPKALHFLTEARKKEPDSPCFKGAESRLKSLIASGKSRSITKSSSLEAASHSTACAIGKALLETGEAEKAFPYVEEAYKASPPECGLALVHAHTALKNYEAAIQVLAELTTPDPLAQPFLDRAAWHYELGLIYESKGETAAARREYETSTRLNPKLEEPQIAIRRLSSGY